MKLETLLFLYEAEKFKDIFDIITAQQEQTADEHNLLILCALKYNLKYDYIQSLETSVATATFDDIVGFKSYIYNQAIKLGLIPFDSTFAGIDTSINEFFLPIRGIIKHESIFYNDNITTLTANASIGNPYFEKLFDEILSNNPSTDELELINIQRLRYSIVKKDFNLGMLSINYLVLNSIDTILQSQKNVVVDFINAFAKDYRVELTNKKDDFKLLLKITDDEFSSLMMGYITQILFDDNTSIKEKVNSLEIFKTIGV